MIIRYLTKEEVIFFNVFVIQSISEEKEQIGIKNETLLESALGRPQATFGGEDLYPSIFHKAAALMESLAQNHAFHNANKRTAFITMVTFLKLNGFHLKMDHDTAVQYTLDVTNGILELEESVALLTKYTK